MIAEDKGRSLLEGEVWKQYVIPIRNDTAKRELLLFSKCSS